MSLPPDDRGFTLGHGLFETVLFEDGRLRHWSAHVARLAQSCPALGLPSPEPEACASAAEVALQAAGAPPRAAERLNWSAGSGGRGLDSPATPKPRLTASAAPLPPAQRTLLSLALSSIRRNESSPAARLKTLAYLDNVLARAEAQAAGADEALMLNSRGEVACAAAGNVFWVQGGQVLTPALDCGVLAGVMRSAVLRACAAAGLIAAEVRARPADLAGAPMFLTNSLIGVRPVSALDGAARPPPDLTPILAALDPG